MAELLSTSIKGNLTVSGTAEIDGKLTAENGIDISSGDLNVSSGSATINNKLTVNGSEGAEITGDTTITGALSANGGNLISNGSGTTINNKLIASNGADIQNGIDVSSGDLSVSSGSATINNKLTVNGSEGAEISSGPLNVFKKLIVKSEGAEITGDTTITGTLNANGGNLISDDSGTTINNKLIASNGADIDNGPLNVSNGNLTVSGTAGIDGKLTAKNGAEIFGDVNIKSVSDEESTKPGNLIVSGNLSANGGNLISNGDGTTINNKLTVNNYNGIEVSYTENDKKTYVFKADGDSSATTAYSSFSVKEKREAEIIVNGEQRVKEEGELVNYLNCDSHGLSINNSEDKTVFNIDSNSNNIIGNIGENGSFSIRPINNNEEKLLSVNNNNTTIKDLNVDNTATINGLFTANSGTAILGAVSISNKEIKDGEETQITPGMLTVSGSLTANNGNFVSNDNGTIIKSSNNNFDINNDGLAYTTFYTVPKENYIVLKTNNDFFIVLDYDNYNLDIIRNVSSIIYTNENNERKEINVLKVCKGDGDYPLSETDKIYLKIKTLLTDRNQDMPINLLIKNIKIENDTSNLNIIGNNLNLSGTNVNINNNINISESNIKVIDSNTNADAFSFSINNRSYRNNIF